MGTIIIRDPAFCEDYIRPHPNGVWGVYRLSYLGGGVPLTMGSGVMSNVTPEAVADALERLQEALPLGIIGEYEILCTGRQLHVYDDDPASGRASAIRCPGWIAISRRVETDLLDILGHELAHELEHRLTETQREEFWHIIGQEPGDRDDYWHRTPQERLAEYLSAAIWALPIDSRMPVPSDDTLTRIRTWVMPILGRGGRARVTIGEQPRIVLTIGSTTAEVDGRPVTLDVAPIIVQDRTLVPVRFVAEALGCRVEWVQETQEVLIY